MMKANCPKCNAVVDPYDHSCPECNYEFGDRGGTITLRRILLWVVVLGVVLGGYYYLASQNLLPDLPFLSSVIPFL